MDDAFLKSRYQLFEELGTGGEARVYRAWDTQTGDVVAARLALYQGEQTMPPTPTVFHPGWVKLLDAGTDPQRGIFQIYELLKGPTLSQLVKFGPLAHEGWRAFVSQSLQAVEALHAAGHVHGDLNADNFMHSGPSEAGWKLLELPFLRFAPPPGRTALFGSIHTLAPEQLNGAQPDARTDIYALGCLYYYAALGQFPHSGSNTQEIAVERLVFAPEHLGEKTTRLPGSESSWVMRLLEREPQNRFASVSAARQLLGVA